MALGEYIKRLAFEFELGAVTQVESSGGKVYAIPMYENFVLSMKELDPGYYFFARIAPFPKDGRAELVEYLMRANVAGIGTGGSVIGLEEDENFLTLSLTIPYEISERQFRDRLEDFCHYRDHWKEELEQLSNKKR